MIALSIIIPVYNVEKYVRQCMESIYNEQTEGFPFEVIVVDDGTPDNSMLIVEKVEKRDNITIIHQENQGLSSARNAGLDVAKGEYVWFVDSDDWLEPYAIKQLIDVISKFPETDIFTVPFIWTYEDSIKNWIDIEIQLNYAITGIEYMHRELHITACQFVVKRNLLNKFSIRFYPGILHEDGLWGFELLYLAQRVRFMQEPLYHYRQREMSIMHNIRIKSGYDIINIHRLLMDFMLQYVKDKDKTWFQKMHLQRLDGAVYVVWKLRGTSEFKKFLDDTQEYRIKACNEAARLGGCRWKVKCWFMKHPILNRYRRLLSGRIKKVFS